MVFFGRKEKIEDRRLLASIDAVNGAKLYHIENGKKKRYNNNLIEDSLKIKEKYLVSPAILRIPSYFSS